ncbi:hypothetical protein Y032_0028g1753 [Ancylostoma ceylanicum]|nr:hypothetical protein Y032_0028g1753 [Ancylostoma ceylanicum]
MKLNLLHVWPQRVFIVTLPNGEKIFMLDPHHDNYKGCVLLPEEYVSIYILLISHDKFSLLHTPLHLFVIITRDYRDWLGWLLLRFTTLIFPLLFTQVLSKYESSSLDIVTLSKTA